MIISAVGTKGGTGKSTLAVHLVGFLVDHGHRLALLDADDQGAAATWATEALPGLVVARASDADAILEVIPELSEGHDHVVVDGPPGSAEPTRAILLRSDRALLPCGPSVLDLRGLADTVRLVKQAQSIRGGPPDALVVLNRMQLNTRLGKHTVAEAPRLGLPVARARVKARQVVADASSRNALVWRMGAAARDATRELRAVCEEALPGAGSIQRRRTRRR